MKKQTFISNRSRWIQIMLWIVTLLIVLIPGIVQAQNNPPIYAAVSDPAWHAQYWNNRSLTGDPALERQDAEINFEWGNGSPDPTIRADRFSARWTRYVLFEAGTYLFRVSSDDGIRVYIDDQLLVSKWHDHTLRTWVVERTLTAGHHLLRVEYYDNLTQASARFSWERADEVLPTPQPPTQWRGEFYNNRTLSGSPVLITDDANINFNWRYGAPYAGVNNDVFSARWTRTLGFDPGTYRFQLTVDDGARVYVNNALLIDGWREQARTTYEADIYLPGGKIPLLVEYFEQGGESMISLTWQPISGSYPTPIPYGTPTPYPTLGPTPTPTAPGYSGGPPSSSPNPLSAKWYAEYFNNTTLSGSVVLARNESEIYNEWGGGSPGGGVNNENFSARWTATVSLAAGRYRFTTETDDGVRLYLNSRLIIDQWRTMGRTRYSYETDLAAGDYSFRMEYFEGTGDATAKLIYENLFVGTPVGNLITCVPPQPQNYAWIKLYRLDGNNQWYSIGKGIGSIHVSGFLKIDGLPVDVNRFGWNGEPYRVEQWIDGKVARSTGNYQVGEPEFRLRPFVDNGTPWGCAK